MAKEYPYSKAIYGDPEKEAVNRVLGSEWLSGSEETAKFEKELAQWWGVKHSLTVNSGSSADLLALMTLDIEEGSEIITPAGGAFPTTISPMAFLHHIPTFIDVSLDNLCLDLDKVEKAISPQTRGIMFAHTLGFMPDMERLMGIAKKHRLKVIEDCADAMGSEQNGKKAGTFGDIATVSFYPAHHMTTGGEGGAILTNSTDLYWKAHSIRDWGRDCKCGWGLPNPVCKDRFKNPPFDHRYFYTNLGMNLKMTEMQAAFGREQLKRVDEGIRLRRRNYKILADSLGVVMPEGMSPFAFPVMTPNKEEAMRKLAELGIHTRTLFGGNILAHPAYKKIVKRVVGEGREHYGRGGTFEELLPNSDKLLKEAFFVGVGPHLSVEDMEFIAKSIREVVS